MAGKLLVAAKLNDRFKSLLEEEGQVGEAVRKWRGLRRQRDTDVVLWL